MKIYMKNKQKITKWLILNSNVSWKKENKDVLPLYFDKYYMDRDDGYDIQNFILICCEEYNFEFTDNVFDFLYKEIQKYERSEKITFQELLNHIKNYINEP